MTSERAAAFEQRAAATVRVDAIEQRFHRGRLRDEGLQISGFDGGKMTPARRWRRARREASYQLPGLLQSETGRQRDLQDRQLGDRIGIVLPSTASSRWGRQESETLVVPN